MKARGPVPPLIGYAMAAVAAPVRVRRRAPEGTTLIGAGGIRHAADLAAGREAGADAWLVASALHDLKLPRAA